MNFDASKSAFGASKSGFGASKSAFGASKLAFGASKSAFGASKSAFGASKSAFGASKSGFGASESASEAVGTGAEGSMQGSGVAGTVRAGARAAMAGPAAGRVATPRVRDAWSRVETIGRVSGFLIGGRFASAPGGTTIAARLETRHPGAVRAIPARRGVGPHAGRPKFARIAKRGKRTQSNRPSPS